MARMQPSPKHGLTPVYRKGEHAGWMKRVNRAPKWIASAKEAPTGDAADAVYTAKFKALWEPAKAPPPPAADALTVKALLNLFLARQQRKGISARAWEEYADAFGDFAKAVGENTRAVDLTPGDFERARRAWAKRFGPHRLGKFVTMVRSAFKWARKPPHRLPEPDYADDFELPGKREYRLAKEASRVDAGGTLAFEADDVGRLLAKANRNLRAMILLGLNCGYGNEDVSALPRAVVDLDGGWLNYARGKTGIRRRCPLWSETAESLRAVLAYRVKSRRRPEAFESPSLVFLTRHGRPYVEDVRSGKSGKLLHKDDVSVAFGKLCAAAGVSRPGRNFYSLRRTFRTLADETGDQRAIALIQGRELGDIDTVYVQHIADSRLLAVTDHVRRRLGLDPQGSRGTRPPSSKRTPGAASKAKMRAPARR